MIYPIVAYGDPVLRKECRDIEKDEIDVKKLSEDMFETMYAASGVGLAAPQIGKDIRVFVVDGQQINDNREEGEPSNIHLEGFKKVFINAEILEEDGDDWPYEEGCLSIPDVRADVYRPEKVTIRYFDTDWNEHTEVYEDIAARIIQHEYDHIDGILFTDHVSPLKKQMLKKKLTNISKGKVNADYKMRFYKK
ncbi:peptide deformylase [Jiulongibacter sediminis]|uniref:Peptide deformylase n=1 Tax=Jiulongibacter sediminis TaxID=1605367 RepID=A0A0P7BMR0_9BACT|nr:peptide deformylase [Jiulongibacter sediminis]KPM48535.1 peptide deformylase [Jiulongibacter sediminis]TBX25074.1 peptide deformylase [Jiulongibacter sediminis]